MTENNVLSSSLQPSLLSAEPLLPPHNFHSHSLRRLPLYQPLHISQPIPACLSVGQPTLPPLPAHLRVLPAHTSLSPPRVPPFLSLPRQQSSYRVDQVCLQKCRGMVCFCLLNSAVMTCLDPHSFNGPYTIYVYGKFKLCIFYCTLFLTFFQAIPQIFTLFLYS